MLQCIIFDMDGTIADTLPLCITCFRKSIETISKKRLTDKEIIDTFGPSEEGTISALLPDHFEEGLNLYLKYYGELHPVMCPRPFYGIAALFFLMKRAGVRIALVTGKGGKSLKITLRVLGLENWFDLMETGKPEGPSKPEGIQRVLDALKILPSEAVYIGDAPSDILAARKVDVPVISAAWAGTADIEDLRKQKPDQICFTVRDLIVYLRSAYGL
ncbi:HAD family hydrolase [Marasmitruncus massiliensis]|uniref:HAD family hydrolase n=1 Tax=Marasmitruncus massiliensis TaxID=1944642 RepID=UPI000C7D9E9B|nr:HAD-IA family hydrolase [Marasmitruncus massiliensis]